MRVRLTVEFRRDTEVWCPGDLLDLDDKNAARLIEAGLAVPVLNDDEAMETR